MSDLISRSALLAEYEWLKSVVNPCSVAEVEEHMERIRNAPAVEAEPVVHAHWVCDCEPYHICSNCRHKFSLFDRVPRCPNCGAHMDKEAVDV